MSPADSGNSLFMRLAAYWGRSAGMITVANGLSQALGLLSTVVLAYFLSLNQYGHYALCAFVASIVAIVINAGSLQGTMMLVFGGGGDDDGDDDDAGQRWLDDVVQLDRRRALTSMLMFTLTLAVALVVIVYMLSTPLTHLLLGRGASHLLIVLAAGAGGLNAVWRYMVNVLRMERRIGGYCLHRLLRPVTVVIAMPVLMVTVGGIRGALLALSGGTLIGLSLLFATTWRSYRLAAHPRDVAWALRSGAPYVPVNLGVGFVHTAGVYLLSGYRGAADVGRFSIASGAAAANNHYVSGLLTSFSPTRRTTIFRAVQREEEPHLRRQVVTTFVTTSMVVGVILALLADELIQVLPAAYHSAASVIPFALLGWTAYGVYMVIYRMTERPHKRVVYVGASVLSVGLYIGFSAWLAPQAGAIGQALAMCLTYTVTATIMVFVSQGGEEPLQLDAPRLIAAAALAGGVVLGARGLTTLMPSLRLAIDLLGITVYVSLVVGLRIVPAPLVASVIGIARGVLGERRMVRSVREQIDQLPPEHSRLLKSLGRGATPAALAASLGMSEQELELRAVAALRELNGLGGPRASDIRLGAYLLSPLSRAERDVLVRRLEEHVDPAEIDLLESSLRLVRRALRGPHRPRRDPPPAVVEAPDAAPLQLELP
jgi:O-antigen/teichoic acid export membrane protein